MFNSFPPFGWGIIDVKVLRLPCIYFSNNEEISRSVAIGWIELVSTFLLIFERRYL
jgi:hypothetical protein